MARGRRGRRRALVLTGAGILAALALAPQAHAHATLVRSVPADASSLAKAPREIRLWLSEPILPKFTRVRLYDAEHRPVAGVRVHTAADAGAGLIGVALPRLPRGAYSLDWWALSENDAHVTRGTLVFAVGAKVVPAAGSRSSATATEPIEVLLRWLNLAAVAFLIGGLAISAFVLESVLRRLPSGSSPEQVLRAKRRALELAWWSAFSGLLVGLGLLGWQIAKVTDSAPGAAPVDAGRQLLFDTRWGTAWLLREICLAFLLVAIWFLAESKRRSKTGASAITTALVLGVVTGQALASHAAGLASDRVPSLAADALHMLAAGVWVGGLFALAVALLPPIGLRTPLGRACLRGFGPVAALSVGVLAVTGLFSAAQHVASLDALIVTSYGEALLAKTALVVAAGALGLASFVTLRWRPRGRLPALVAAEISAGLLVLLVVGILTASAPARGPEFSPSPAIPVALTRSVGDLLVAVSVKPNRPGPNVVTVRAVSTQRPALAEIRRVFLRLTPASDSRTVTAAAREVGPGTYRLGGDQLALEGPWRIDTVVQRPGLEDAVARFDWTVAPSVPPRAVIVSDRPLKPLLTRAAGVLLLALVVGCTSLLLVRRRPQRPAERPVDLAAEPLQKGTP